MSHHDHDHHCHSHEPCRCPCHQSHPHTEAHSYADELLHLADEAWRQVLLELIKKEILQHSGEHITGLAQLVGKANHERWKYLLTEKEKGEEFKNQLRAHLNKQSVK